MDSETLFRQWSTLVATMPSFSVSTFLEDETQRWLGRCHALLRAVDNNRAADALEAGWQQLGETFEHDDGIREIKRVVYSALGRAEVAAPASVRGTFIAAGSAFDAFASVGKVLSEATKLAFLIDPYMDERLLIDFVPLAPEGINIRLLADKSTVKPTFKAAVSRWGSQYGASRPLEARLAPERTLHDRSILLDGRKAWILTQSFKDLAARSPASISLLDAGAAALKVAAYDDLWAKSQPV